MIEAITLQESSRLIELEKIVVAGMQSWIEVGEALIEIRDSRLYRIEAKTFEEYCQSRFKMSRQHANRLISSAPIARSLETTVSISEKAVREIAKVAPEKRQEVFQKATESASGHVPTARVIKQVVEEVSKKEIYPVDRIEPAEESIEAGEAATKESESLLNLKWNWRRASKGDRSKFSDWVKPSLDTITKDDASREKVRLENIFRSINRLLMQSKRKGRRDAMRKAIRAMILDTLQKDEEAGR
jgi:hypothetical protein